MQRAHLFEDDSRTRTNPRGFLAIRRSYEGTPEKRADLRPDTLINTSDEQVSRSRVRSARRSTRGHDIGTCPLYRPPPEVFYTICAHHIEHVLWDLYEHWEEEELEEWDATAAANGFMLFKEWQHMVKNRRSYTFGNERDTDYQKRFDAIVEWRALRLYNTHRYDHNFDGWKSYLCDASPFFAERLLFKEFPVRLPREKVLNCYIVAASQSGKTELLKLFAHSIITQGREALICIEPAGDASRQIALWPECKDRLIYVDLSLDLSRAPTVNPFEIYGIKAEDTSPAALDVKTVVAQQLLTAFQEVLGTGAGAELSKNMRTIILPCLMVLLDWPGATPARSPPLHG